MLNITKNNFDEVLSSELPVVLDFWAPWCGPCRLLSPILDELAAEYRDKIRFYKVNVDEETELAARFHIASIPTLVFFRNGEVQDTCVGFREKDRLVEALDWLIA